MATRADLRDAGRGRRRRSVMPLANALLLGRLITRARLFVAAGEGHLLLMDGMRQALPVIGGFLSASDLDRSPAWQQATVVSGPMLEAGLPGGLGSLANPWALTSAGVREFRRWQRDRASRPAHRTRSGSSSSIGTPSASSTRGTIE